MIRVVNKKKQKKQWCPMEGTPYEGFCVENFATIRLKDRRCDHRDYCENLKNDLDKLNHENKRN